jgi:ACS family glucarate transporter-like MFS transporter
METNGVLSSLDGVGTAKRGNVRYFIVFMLFLVGAVNYADRAIFSLAGPAMMKSLGMDALSLGFLMSTFGWAYVIGQLPGGWLLDRFGAKRVYISSLFLWSLFTALMGFAGHMGAAAGSTIFFLVFMLSLAESPSFPANARIVASWFPTRERGTASAIFNASQYFALVLFMPIMGWIVHKLSWEAVFWFMGSLGIIMSLVMVRVIYSPKDHPKIGQEELNYITTGGALVDVCPPGTTAKASQGPKLGYIKQLFQSRMMVGIFVGQYCITTLTWFFTTWFPIYLVQARHMSVLKVGIVAVLPAICGCLGGILGGMFSDFLLRKKCSQSVARKTPIVLGMLLAMTMLACNYVNTTELVVFFLSLAFFGKGFGALGWAVVSDTAPREIVGLCGGVFNLVGNMAGIVTPLVIGFILKTTGSFNGALVFVSLTAALAICSYLFVVGNIQRLELKEIK